MKKIYSSAPLPFVGQKRMFATKFIEILKVFPDDATFVDLFGGSGLLSHITKREKPHATVVYNDYDNYRRRLENIKRTNNLLSDLRIIISDYPRKALLPSSIKTKILKRIKIEEDNGFVDYITISSSLLFSMKYCLSFDELSNESFYNNIRKQDYPLCSDYLEGLTIVSCDYKELFNEYKNIPNTVFLVDPPYLSTDVGTYKMNWRLSDYLDVLPILVNRSFIYFTSNKSSILELCCWMDNHPGFKDPFKGAKRNEFKARMNYNSTYTDIMIHKK